MAQNQNYHFCGATAWHPVEIRSVDADVSKEVQTVMPLSKKLNPNEQIQLQDQGITIGLTPESPYSNRAEIAEQAFADRMAAGEYPEHYNPNADYSKIIFGK